MWRVRYGNSRTEWFAFILTSLISFASLTYSKQNHGLHKVAIHPRARVPIAPQPSYIRKRLSVSLTQQADVIDEYESPGSKYLDATSDPALNFVRKKFLDTGVSVRQFLENVLSLSNRNNNENAEEDLQKVKKNLRWKSRHVIGKWKPLNETVLQQYMERFSLDNKLAKLYSGLKDKVNHNFTLKSNGTHFNLGISDDPAMESEKNLLEIKDGYININSTFQRSDSGNKSKGSGMEGDFVVMTEKNVTLHTSVGKWLKSIGLADRNSQLIWHIRKEDVTGGDVGSNNSSNTNLQRNKTLLYNNNNTSNNIINANTNSNNNTNTNIINANTNNNANSNNVNIISNDININRGNEVNNNIDKSNNDMGNNRNNSSSVTSNSSSNNNDIFVNKDDNSTNIKDNISNSSSDKVVNNSSENNNSKNITNSITNNSISSNGNNSASSNASSNIANDNKNNIYKNISSYTSNEDTSKIENNTINEHLDNSTLKQHVTDKWDVSLQSEEKLNASMVSYVGNTGEVEGLKLKNISNVQKSALKGDISSDIDVEVAPLSQTSVLDAYNDVNKGSNFNNDTVGKNTTTSSYNPARENHAQKFDVAYANHAPLFSQIANDESEEKEAVENLMNDTMSKKNISNSMNDINTSKTTTTTTTTTDSNDKDNKNNTNDDKNTGINNNSERNMTTTNIKIIRLNEYPSLVNALITSSVNKSKEYKPTAENQREKERSDNSLAIAHADEEKRKATMEETTNEKNASLPLGMTDSFSMKKKKKKFSKEEDNDEFDATSNDDNPEKPFVISKFAENTSGGTSLTNTSLLKQMIVEQLNTIQMTKDVAAKVIGGGESNESVKEGDVPFKGLQNAIKDDNNEQTVEWKTSKEEERLSDVSESKDAISKRIDDKRYTSASGQNEEFDSKIYREPSNKQNKQNEDHTEAHEQEDSRSKQTVEHASEKNHYDELDLEDSEHIHHSLMLDQNKVQYFKYSENSSHTYENADNVRQHQTAEEISKNNQSNELNSRNDRNATQNNEHNAQIKEKEKSDNKGEDILIWNHGEKNAVEYIKNADRNSKNTELVPKEKVDATNEANSDYTEDDDLNSNQNDDYDSEKSQSEEYQLKSNQGAEETEENGEKKKEKLNGSSDSEMVRKGMELSQKESDETDQGNKEKDEVNEEEGEKMYQIKPYDQTKQLASEKEERNETASLSSTFHKAEESFDKRNITSISDNRENDKNNNGKINNSKKINNNEDKVMEADYSNNSDTSVDLDDYNNNRTNDTKKGHSENNSGESRVRESNNNYGKNKSMEQKKNDVNDENKNISSNAESNSEQFVSQLKQVTAHKQESDDDISYTNEDDGGFEGDSEETNNSEDSSLEPLQFTQVKNVRVDEAASHGYTNVTTMKKKIPNTSWGKEMEGVGNSGNSLKNESLTKNKSNSDFSHNLPLHSKSAHEEKEKSESISQLKEPIASNNEDNSSYTAHSRHSTAKSVKRVLLIKHNFDEEDEEEDEVDSSGESSGDDITKKNTKKLQQLQRQKQTTRKHEFNRPRPQKIPPEKKEQEKAASTIAKTFHEVGLGAKDDKMGGGGGISSGGSPPITNHQEKHSDHGEETVPSPKIIDIENVDNSFCSMAKKLTVKYRDNENKVETIDCGGNYNYSNAFEHPPLVGLDRANVNGIYTFLMLDADAPSPFYPVARCVVHWMVVNIIEADIGRGSTVVPYKPPDPITTTGPHRYVFLLLKQKEMEPVKEFNLENQCNLDVNEFANRHNITYIEGFKYFTTQSKIDYLVLTQRHNL